MAKYLEREKTATGEADEFWWQRLGKPGAVEQPAAQPMRLNWELAAYGLLLVLAVVTRFWDLGYRGLHHDESLHATYSWYLYVGRGYQHDPMMHGPFQFHFPALVYFLFGANDYTARVAPAVFGVALVVLPYLLRGFLGRTGALITSTLILFSPILMYYGRFLREDAYTIVWTFLIVIGIWRYLADPQPRWLYLLSAGVVFGFATKEVTFISVVIFGGFLALLAAREIFDLVRRRSLDLRTASAPTVALLVMGTLALPQFSAGSQLVQKWLNINLSQPLATFPGYVLTTGAIAGGLVVLGLFAIGTWLGTRWNGAVYLRCALIFYGVYVVLFTTFFSNLPGFVSGIWGALDYWMVQHGVQRGSQPFYYYFVLIPVYEFLPIVFAVAGAIVYVKRRDLFGIFLVYWTLASFLAYAIAGEKMPWLAVYMVLPVVLIAGRLLGELVSRTDWAAVGRTGGYWLGLTLPLSFLALIGVGTLLASGAGLTNPPRLLQAAGLVVVVAVLAGLTIQLGQRLGDRQFGYVASLTLAVILGLLTIRAAWQLSFYHGDVPVEMAVYTQTSPDVPRIMRDIDLLAERTGQGKNLKITVDSTESHTWPWAWYLREYKNVDYPSGGTLSGPPLGSVLMLHASHEQRMKPYLTKYTTGQRYNLRWWFVEDDYRQLSFAKLLAGFFDPAELQKKWRYFLYRDTKTPGASVGIVYFPKDAPLGLAAPPRAAAEPSSDEYTARAVNVPASRSIGAGKGAGPGQFSDPRGVAVDGQGNLYVADTLNHRVQKFDRTGRLLTQIGGRGNGDGQFNEPWGIAVDGKGFVYVTDTWNHRIQKFDADLQFVARWGGDLTDSGGRVDGNLGRFYGPRSIAFDRQGNVLVTDAGNHRVQRLDPDGRPLGAFGGPGGGPGQFQEPIGIAVDKDGDIYVADTWNRRIQRFTADQKFIGEIPVQGWESNSVVNKPNLAIEPTTGNILATDPENHRVLRFAPNGKLLAVAGRPGADATGFNLPIGIATDASGNVYVADSLNSRIQVLPAFR